MFSCPDRKFPVEFRQSGSHSEEIIIVSCIKPLIGVLEHFFPIAGEISVVGEAIDLVEGRWILGRRGEGEKEE
jgi:hypothetical protein